MMDFDDIDLEILRENFDEDMINEINYDNVLKIFNYLNNNGVYYATDLLLSSLDLFLLPYEVFVKHFENLKNELGIDFVNRLGDDASLIEIMYEDC